jgi:hypothetical protein
MVGDRGLQSAVVQIALGEKASTILDEGRLKRTLAYAALRAGLNVRSRGFSAKK